MCGHPPVRLCSVHTLPNRQPPGLRMQRSLVTWSPFGGEAHAEPGLGATEVAHVVSWVSRTVSLRALFCYSVWKNEVLHQSVEGLACPMVFSLPGGAQDSMGAPVSREGGLEKGGSAAWGYSHLCLAHPIPPALLHAYSVYALPSGVPSEPPFSPLQAFADAVCPACRALFCFADAH